jgi:hypothetical protein
MVKDITPMNADLKRPYVISATKRDTLRRYAKERRYQIHGSYTYSQGLGIIVSSVEAVVFSWHVAYAQVLHCTNFVV